MMSTDQHIQQNMNDNSNNSNNSNNNNTNNNNNNQSVKVNVNNTNNNTQTISNLSAGLKSVSLTDQQQNEVNLNLLQQQLHQEASTQQQQSRITQFFQNQPTEGFTLFSHRSAPNGFKVAIILSELNLPFNTFFLDFNNGEQRTPEFVTINPNARVPALIDHYNDNTSIWESGAITLYLVSKYLKENGECSLWSNNLIEQSQISSWLFFQTSGHAPMIGQALHFRYFHSCPVPSAVERYTDEVRRVYGVIEMALAERREALIMDLDVENAAAYSAGTTPLSQSRFFDHPVWLVGDRTTVADLSFVPWNNVVDRIGINLKVEFPEVYKWTKHMMQRPAVKRALRGD
ncbi:protein URE2 [Candida albicans P57072]|nr:protein URE2 [Candida albicans P57072]